MDRLWTRVADGNGEPVPCCVLLTGPRHSGKSDVVNTLTSELGWHQVTVELLNKFEDEVNWTGVHAELEAIQRQLADHAQGQQPPATLLVLDNVDALQWKRQLLQAVLDLIDHALAHNRVVVGTCRRLHLVPRALRAPPYFDICIELQPKYTRGGSTLVSEGFGLPVLTSAAPASGTARFSPLLTPQRHVVPPSAFHGYSDTVKRIMAVVTSWRKGTLHSLGLTPPSGLLLHGPPGCGKTLLALTIASTLDLPLFQVSATSIFSKYLGETEANIRQLFTSARACRPSVVLFDGIEAFAPRRGGVTGQAPSSTGVGERALSQLLNEMDGIEATRDVLMIGCTSQPLATLDAAILRPGRLEMHVHLPLPTESDRRAIVEGLTSFAFSLADHDDVEFLVQRTDGSSGARIHQLLVQAHLHSWHCSEPVLTHETLQHVLTAHRNSPA